ncbi:restriction endonuclease subunit S [Streptococcus mitis]|uniref:Type I restriction modification DNA specificity domain-containing protein n=1 Tax=Streptococcus mitis TaxID=28037 RepID=A0A1X1L816_STRMT|nr:restriction endonuclease subunit S [Streptococcus mitis]ORP07853.1 hypothetical protein B7692_02730 [Streptococcus mitis]
MKQIKIRFKEFINDWSYTRLKEVKDVRDGTHSSPKYIDNGYPLVTSKNLSDSGLDLNDVSLISESDYNEINKRSKVEVGDILLGLIGTIGKPVLVETDGFAIKNVGLIKNGGQIQNQFLLQYLKTNLFNKYIQIEMAGNTQKFLGLETLRNTKIPVPSPAEQTAIGSLFRILDVLLSSYMDNLTNYQFLKATMLSKMFPKVGQTVPEIRLEGFKGEWEKSKLKDIAHRVQGNDGRMDLPTLTISASGGWMNQIDRFSANIAGKEQKNYTLLKKGELSYNHGNSKLAKYGVVFELQDYEEALVPKVYHSFRVNQLADAKFIEIMFSTKIPDRELGKLISSGARMDGLLNISFDDFMNIAIIIPTIKEQQAIGSYFSNLDNLINSHQEKITQLETLKKKLLQDMFI